MFGVALLSKDLPISILMTELIGAPAQKSFPECLSTHTHTGLLMEPHREFQLQQLLTSPVDPFWKEEKNLKNPTLC